MFLIVGDKARTYDHARLEFNYMDAIFYVDADELFYCPQASTSKPHRRLSATNTTSNSTSTFNTTAIALKTNNTNVNTSQSIIPNTSTLSINHTLPRFPSLPPSLPQSLPQSPSLLEQKQKQYQQKLMSRFSSLGIEEMRFVRIPYSGITDYVFVRTIIFLYVHMINFFCNPHVVVYSSKHHYHHHYS